jgi:hypothetical protein
MHRFVVRGASLLASLWLAACGGGQGTEDRTGPMPRPLAAAAPAEQCTESAAAAGTYRLSDEGCFRSSAMLGLSIPASPRAGVAPALSPDEAMDWAQQTFPSLFPAAGSSAGYAAPYSYRYYPGSGNYLGISTGSSDVAIYVYGPASGGEIVRIAALADYTCVIVPQRCQLAVTPAALSLQATEGGRQEADLLVTLPAIGSGTWKAEAEYPSGSWLSTAVQGSYTVRVTALAGEFAPATREGSIMVTYTPASGGTPRGVRIPVTLKVVQGLIGPPAQMLTMDANTVSANLTGTVPIARGDGVAAPWSAISSQPWLVLSPSSGTTPSTLRFTVDAALAGALANNSDHTAIVTISAPAVKETSFRVTLRKQLPTLATVMPYGIPAGRKSRLIVGGTGLAQVADMSKSLKATGLTLSNIRVLSDRQVEMEVTPAAAGTYTLTLGPGAGVKIQVTAADPYAAASWAHPGDDFLSFYVHDPVRKAVFASTNWLGSAVYKFQYRDGNWFSEALPVSKPINLGLTPDGSRLVVATDGALKIIDPDTFRIVDSLPISLGVQQGGGGPLAVTADNRMWLPGSYSGNRMGYLDLTDYRVRQLEITDPKLTYLESADFVASADGSRLLVAPDYCCTPRDPWFLYLPADGSITNPMGKTEFWYDARVSADGSRVALQNTGEVYDGRYELLGKLPPAPGLFWSRLALTPDGKRIAALATEGSIVTSIEVFDTTAIAPGTTSFKKVGSIPVTQQSADCRQEGTSYDVYGCLSLGRLIATLDGRAVIWMGNKRIQVFKLP